MLNQPFFRPVFIFRTGISFVRVIIYGLKIYIAVIIYGFFSQLPSFLEDPQGSKLTPEVAQKVGYARNLMEALSQDRPVTVNELLCIINSVKTEALLHQAREPDPQPSAPAASQSQFPRTPAPKPRENEMKSDKTQKIQSLAKKTPAKPDIASKPAPKISPQASASSFSSGGKSGGSAIKSVVKSASDLPSFKEILQLQAMAVVPQRFVILPYNAPQLTPRHWPLNFPCGLLRCSFPVYCGENGH